MSVYKLYNHYIFADKLASWNKLIKELFPENGDVLELTKKNYSVLNSNLIELEAFLKGLQNQIDSVKINLEKIKNDK